MFILLLCSRLWGCFRLSYLFEYGSDLRNGFFVIFVLSVFICFGRSCPQGCGVLSRESFWNKSTSRGYMLGVRELFRVARHDSVAKWEIVTLVGC